MPCVDGKTLVGFRIYSDLFLIICTAPVREMDSFLYKRGHNFLLDSNDNMEENMEVGL